MTPRPILGPARTGSISRIQARKAVRAVKAASAGKERPVSESERQRYLGHFGVGVTRPGAQAASDMRGRAGGKSRATPSAAKRGAAKESVARKITRKAS